MPLRPTPVITPREENWLALSLVQRVGGRTVRRLLEAFGSVDAVLEANPEALARHGGVDAALAARLARARQMPAFRIERRLVDEQGVRLIPLDAPEYPAPLNAVYAPPPLLYCQGVWPLPAGPWLAVVGTRGHSRYGERMTRRLIAELAELEPRAVIVSGLARGIDTLAHEEALARGLHTVAVLGGGLTHIYPPENRELATRIQAQGALLSEFPMTARPLARNFPIRNRVIAGLGDAVLVVEAGTRSGALITASFALNYGRPVLAVPGNADETASEGANRLIRSGQGRLVLDGADLLAALTGHAAVPGNASGTQFAAPQRADGRELREPPAASPSAAPAPAARRATRTGRSAREGDVSEGVVPKAAVPEAVAPEGDKGRILACLRQGALHPDALVGETGLPIERLIALLLELELAEEIHLTPENHYALA